MFKVFVVSKSIPSSAKLKTKFALVSRRIHVVGFNMFKNISLDFGSFETVVALPVAINILGHLGQDDCLQI